MSGTHPFVYLSTCGCVFSQAGLRAISTSSGPTPPATDQTEDNHQEQKDICPQCSTKFARSTDIVLLNPTPDEELQMRESMEKHRASQAASKPKKSKKRKTDEMPVSEPAAKRSALESSHKTSRTSTAQSAAPFTNNATATSRVVSSALALEEHKRKTSMSDAVKSLYTPKDGVPKKETFMTRGTFTRVRCYICVYRILLMWQHDIVCMIARSIVRFIPTLECIFLVLLVFLLLNFLMRCTYMHVAKIWRKAYI
jgi:hypothetical protein